MANENPFDAIAIQAAADTDAELAGDEAKIGLVAQDKLKQMLPNQLDQKNLDQLIQTVNAATTHNEQVAALISNISTFGGVIVKLLRNVR